MNRNNPVSPDGILWNDFPHTDIEMEGFSAEEVVNDFEFKRHPIMRFYEYLGMTGAEWNYSVGVPLNYTTTYSTLISPNAGLGIALGWNYVDAVYAIGLGTLQLLDEEDYRQTQNKVKGVFNIISGVQLFLLSYNPYLTAVLGLTGGAALAAPAFALAMACDLVTASIDLYNASKEVEFEGWLEERAKEIHYNQSRIQKLTEQIQEVETSNKTPAEKKSEIAYLEAKIIMLKDKINKIEDNLYARSRVYCNEEMPNSETQEKAARQWKVEKILDKYNPSHNKDRLKVELKKNVTERDRSIDNNIQADLEKNYKENRINFFIKTASLVGMTLLAVSAFVSCPPVLITGLAITSVVATYYIYKNGGNIMQAVNNAAIKFGLFGQNNKETKLEGNTSEPKLMLGQPYKNK